MKNNKVKPNEKSGLPELAIQGLSGKLISRISHTHPIYWLISIAAILSLLLKFMPSFIWIDLWSGLKAQGALVSLILIFSLVSLSLLWSVGQRIDVWVFMYFNMHGRRAPWLDWLMLTFTQMGNGIFATVIAAILFFRVNRLLAYELALGTLTLWMLVELIKVLIHRNRPFVKIKKMRTVGLLARGRSFPSGHTSQSFFMATLLLHYYQVDVPGWMVLYAIALSVGITRIYLGMHYPRDVIGGAILGTAWGLLGVIANNYIG